MQIFLGIELIIFKSLTLSRFKSFKIGSECAIYLLCVTVRIAFFCILLMELQFWSHTRDQGSLYLTGNEIDYVIRHTHERDRPILGSVKIDKAKYTS